VIRLTLPYPISANRYWATRVMKIAGKWMPSTYVTSEAKDFKKEVVACAQRAGITVPLAGRIQTYLQLYPQRPKDWQARVRKFGWCWDDTVRCLDIDNVPKVTFDALKGVVIDDDGWQHRRMTVERMEPDDDGERLVVCIVHIVAPVVQADLLGATA
jgi:crossover junction endodeoxyribonuclease RusA